VADCVVLPSLNGGGIKSVAEDLTSLPPVKSFTSEEDFRKYWAEVVRTILCERRRMLTLSTSAALVWLPTACKG
jgi:hypothetical protein